METCDKPAKAVVPRLGMYLACVLEKEHSGECQPGGECFKHGKYIGEKCPEWPSCVKL